MKSPFAKVLSDLNYQNQVLKGVIFGLMTVLLVALCALLLSSYRGPTVVGLTENGEVTELSDQLTDRQIEAAVRRYVRLRYNWQKANLGQQSHLTEAMITNSSLPAFRKTIADLVKFTSGKSVEQRVYARSIDVDRVKGSAFVVADRINEIEGLKAATDLKVALKFQVGDRTVSNPWGIYIEKEAEGASR